MASNMLDNVKPTITKHSAEFQKDAYASHPTGELVVFVLAVLQAETSSVAMEEIVSTCFRLFPNSFALRNYFYWPDSALVARHLQHAKEKGLLKGNPTDGYELKGKGKQSAKQTAKALNVLLPVLPKAEIPVVVEKKEEVTIPATAEEKVVAPAAKKTPAKPVAKKQVKKQPVKKETAKPKSKPTQKKEPSKVDAPVKKKPAPTPKAEVKKPVKSAAKAKQTKPAPKTQAKPVAKSEPNVKPVEKAPPKPVVKREPKSTPKSAAPQQLSMEWTAPTAKKKAEAPALKPKVKNEAPSGGDKSPIKGEVLTPMAVSKEEKDKAAKVIKQIERSDAYQLYRRNGRRAQIGDFDFRNMLFATMESSPETLKRNLDLFKRYASIHFRTDLIAFLEFCEESFAALMISKVKGKK